MNLNDKSVKIAGKTYIMIGLSFTGVGGFNGR